MPFVSSCFLYHKHFAESNVNGVFNGVNWKLFLDHCSRDLLCEHTTSSSEMFFMLLHCHVRVDLYYASDSSVSFCRYCSRCVYLARRLYSEGFGHHLPAAPSQVLPGLYRQQGWRPKTRNVRPSAQKHSQRLLPPIKIRQVKHNDGVCRQNADLLVLREGIDGGNSEGVLQIRLKPDLY